MNEIEDLISSRMKDALEEFDRQLLFGAEGIPSPTPVDDPSRLPVRYFTVGLPYLESHWLLKRFLAGPQPQRDIIDPWSDHDQYHRNADR